MEDTAEVRRSALQGAWGAAAAALQQDWEGFDSLVAGGVRDPFEACAWALAAVGGVQAIIRGCDLDPCGWSAAVDAAIAGDLEAAISELRRQIVADGAGVTVGRAIGQLAVAVTVVARMREQDPVRLAQQLCLDVAGT